MILQEAALICILALAEMVAGFGHIPPQYDERLRTCIDIARTADEHELPVALVVALAHEESRFVADIVSKAGARGPLQIIPRYFCPNAQGELAPHKRAGRLEGCDLIVDGVKAVKWFWVTYDNDWSAALCHYNSGEKCFARSRGYAESCADGGGWSAS